MTITITKIAIARQQLDTAVQLFFEEKYTCSHALSHAANEVLEDIYKIERDNILNKQFPLEDGQDLNFSMREIMKMLVKKEGHKELHKLLSKDANFFKHANRDHQSSLEYDEEKAEIFLFMGIYNHIVVDATWTAHMATFFMWWTLKNPQFVKPSGIELQNEISSISFPVHDFERWRMVLDYV